MSNSVSIERGIAVVRLSGDQSYDDIARLSDMLWSIATDGILTALLLDASKMGTADSGARRAAGELVQRIYCNRIALFGSSPFVSALVLLISYTSGRNDALKVFSSKSKATRWLCDEKG